MWKWRLGAASLWARKGMSLLTLLAIALSVSLYLSVEKIRSGTEENFSQSISQTSLIVGAKTGPLHLLLYSVFHIGSPINNVSMSAYEKYTKHPAVDWTIPLSLGDSYRGYRVVATNEKFFEHYRFRQKESLKLQAGSWGSGLFDVVLGAEVAEKLRHSVGDPVILAHGLSEGDALYDHGDKPFRVVGILARTWTPIDRSLYISLEGMEAIHQDWKDGVPPEPGETTKSESLKKADFEVEQITSFLLRTRAPQDILRLKREIDEDTKEPLMAVIPGVALSELWRGVDYAQMALRAMGLLVVFVGLLTMCLMLLASLESRRREMALLRAMGARKMDIVLLLSVEAFCISLAGIFAGILLTYASLWILGPWVETVVGAYLPLHPPTSAELGMLAAFLLCGVLMGFIPAWRAYRASLHDGLAPS